MQAWASSIFAFGVAASHIRAHQTLNPESFDAGLGILASPCERRSRRQIKRASRFCIRRNVIPQVSEPVLLRTFHSHAPSHGNHHVAYFTFHTQHNAFHHASPPPRISLQRLIQLHRVSVYNSRQPRVAPSSLDLRLLAACSCCCCIFPPFSRGLPALATRRRINLRLRSSSPTLSC